MKINMKALASFLTVICGVVTGVASHPEVIATLPAKVGTAVIIAGAVASAVTGAVHKPTQPSAE